MESQHKTQIASAILSILRPLIRLLIRHEVTHAEATELVRQTYVDVAYDEYGIPGQEMTVSRAAVLTGLSRREVVRLREALNSNEPTMPLKPNRAQRVVHGWLSDPEFLDAKQKPKNLPLKNKKGNKEAGSFVALVKRYSGDITYGAVLDELNLIGVTEQPNEHLVKLVNSAYVPREDELEQFRIIATSVSDLFNSAVFNIDAAKDDRRFQRQVVYSHISEELAQSFRTHSSEKAAPFVEELNSYLARRKKTKSSNKPQNLKRVGFGIYYFEEDQPDDQSSSNKK